MPSSPPTPARKALGKSIAEIRAARGYTQEELAHRVGVTLRQLAGIEAGRSTTTATLESIAHALGAEIRITRRR